MIFNKKELQVSVNKIKLALSDANIIQFKGLLIFDGKKLVSYGDEISVSTPLETDFVAAVGADKFIKLINKISKDEFDLTKDEEKNKLFVKCDKMKAQFACADYDENAIPDIGLEQVKKWNDFPEDFAEAIGFCSFSASNDPSYGVLCNLKVESNRVLSSDNYRITERILSKKISELKEPLFIRNKVASFLTGFELSKFVITDTCAHYKDDSGAVFTHRLMKDEYPEIDEFMKVDGPKLQLPKEIIDVLDRAKTVIDDENIVELIVNKEFIEVKAKGMDAEIKEPVKFDYDGDELKFKTSPEHLIQILKKTQEVIIGESSLLFVGENFRHVVCLISEE